MVITFRCTLSCLLSPVKVLARFASNSMEHASFKQYRGVGSEGSMESSCLLSMGTKDEFKLQRRIFPQREVC